MINIPDEKMIEPMVKFAKTLEVGKLYGEEELGKNSEAKFKLLEKYDVWLWFTHQLDIVIFSDKVPDEKSWDWKSKSHKRFNVKKQLRRNV